MLVCPFGVASSWSWQKSLGRHTVSFVQIFILSLLCHPLLEKTRRHKSTRPPLPPSRSSSHTTSTVVSTAALHGVLGIVLERASFTAVDTALLMASLMLWLAILLTSRSCGCYKVALSHPVYHLCIILQGGDPHVTFANDMNHKNYMIRIYTILSVAAIF